jgi:alcohol/geraniol dehydrogenase (NADP+)
VSGHEIVGIVEAVGSGVTSHKVGDRCAVGWYRESCRTCKYCLTGRHSLCDKSVAVAAFGNNGGFAEKLVLPADHAIHVPEGLADEHAAPLMCGGITVFSPLVDYDAVGKRVAICGLGGIGAMGVQLAKARGNVVTAVSTSADKQALAKEMGADKFINIKDEAAVKAAERSIDLMIVTFNAAVDFRPYINMLDKDGVLCFIGAVPGAISVEVFGDVSCTSLLWY